MNYVTLEDGSQITVSKALKELYSPIEEAKADVVGIYCVPFLMDKGWIPAEKEREIYTSYLAGMFRSLRFGTHEAHGKATLIQLNFHREQGAFLYDEATGKFSVDMSKIKESQEILARKLLILEGDGDYEKAEAFITRYGTIDEVISQAIEKLKGIPVDIVPVFPGIE